MLPHSKQRSDAEVSAPRETWALEWCVQGRAAPYKYAGDHEADQSITRDVDQGTYLACFGQDACMLSSSNADKPPCHVLGVADGVGGWATWGYDSGVFARELMYQVQRLATDDSHRPEKLLADAAAACRAGGKVQGGSTTACIVSLDPVQRQLHTTNLGDCGYALFRGRDVHFVSTAQRLSSAITLPEQSSSSTTIMLCSPQVPFQMAILPDYLKDESDSFRNDPPESAHCETHKDMQVGDVLLLASDGLFDNLFPNATQALQDWWLAQLQDSAVPDLEQASRDLFAYAQQRMNQPLGKPDDLVMVLARITTK